MECVVDSNWVISLLWSAAWLLAVIKMDKVNGFESGLQDVFSTPVISSLILSLIYIYFTYEMPEFSDKGLSGIVINITYGLNYAKCSFVSVLNVWGSLLMIVAMYKFIQRNFPFLIEGVIEKTKNVIERIKARFGN
jgi:hypothetical protein